MSNLFNMVDPQRDPRNRRPTLPDGQPLPTLEDYQRLAQSYADLRLRFIEQTKALDEKNNELTIKNEVLERQTADVRQLEAAKSQVESELVFTKAALQQAQKQQEQTAEANWQERYLQLQAETQAEIDNLRKRWEQRFITESTEARHRILADMLPLADHLELALQHANVNDEGARSFVANIEATRRAFMETLKRYGVEPLDAQGKPFDPNLHEAVAHLADAQTPPEHVLQVIQVGYMDNGKLLRPARVVISGA
ncbi:MAG: nucleotide exchange factor GrpE [Caldilineaceae bacterium]